ncbi:hypothetical protein [Polluticoccus soli]|uniref:hypothetical protein n=1 Tax=Polluticoccus soli TaxID=3034150 RepID=UPI0023E1677B|nr:hypothetical protein [Flavipsychrobacter sp. JY13-12]
MRDEKNEKKTGREPEKEDEKKPLRVVNAEELAQLPELPKEKRPKLRDWDWMSGSDGGSGTSGAAA